jgi:choline dehydrogenase-like flavoprotein
VRRALRHLGCVVPPGMTHVRPMGASVHYAGTFPMTDTDEPWTTTDLCRSRAFENLYLVDGSTFPALPSKNFTFTLMANAVRVATEAF